MGLRTSEGEEVTFDEPGTYVLRAMVGDSALTTSKNLTVTVTR